MLYAVAEIAVFMIGATIVALGRSYYLLYVLKKGNFFSKIITWGATAVVAGFWGWHWVTVACQ